ncbi:1-deoxy-D-xylulose-5-phosphate reductoisomerase [Scopulibacillus daqui]|uniref:1-deoxy-D-xylulose 5-phosphate reductoisomerase n=1 Tax=Scopulibacillus daqui TaxID=1469162 RepID=A0ABS2PXE5_9BACL|nr:1-deoxy-D-xylulose-5-phosphate reductoisomerase [Scopulibacillus daqui]MBM7644380.1 1-deoxy-D-xylulose-5-phosphate reductoisomerase [Scopulibacillus daqui]
MKNITLLGATGSIGTQTLEVVKQHPDRFNIAAISFGQNIERGIDIIKAFKPELVAVKNEQVKDELLHALSLHNIRVVSGLEGLIEAATYPNADILVNAVMGSVGLKPTLAAIHSGKDIAIANKETLVTAGHFVMEKANEKGVRLLPVDSEHSAIFQSLEGHRCEDVSRLILTASGGSFRDRTREELKDVSVQDALNHPNWSMGAKITIDSATLMNKGLEVIEAHWLFNMPYEKIDVVIHKESIVHSLVEYYDKSVIAQLGNPDMKGPIQYALSYPERLELKDVKRLNLWEAGTLHFQKVDMNRFRSLALAYEAGRTGGSLPTVLNAANEAAVEHFLKGRIAFLDIESLVESALEAHKVIKNPDLETIEEIDSQTRRFINDKAADI